jgi:hypothetical protein
MALSKFSLLVAGMIAAFAIQLCFGNQAKSQDNNAVIDAAFIPVVEDALHVLYFYDERPTGVTSNALMEAIKAFQKQNGMRPTGQLTYNEFFKLLEQSEQYRFSQIVIDPLEGVGELPAVSQTENTAYAAGTWVVPDDDKDFPSTLRKLPVTRLNVFVTKPLRGWRNLRKQPFISVPDLLRAMIGKQVQHICT